MSPGEKVKEKLAASAEIVALVGTRIFPNQIPSEETALPAIVYFDVDRVPQGAMDSTAAQVLSTTRVQVDMYGLDYSDLKVLGDLVTDVVDAERLSFTAWEIGERDYWDAELGAHRISRDYAVHAKR